MRISAVLLITTAALLLAVGGAIGFLAGRTSVPSPAAMLADLAETTISTFDTDGFRMPNETVFEDPRANLLRALERPAPERDRAVRLAMNAWLAAEGEAAILAARDDPALADVSDRMMRLALFAYPEIFVDNPALLEGIANSEQMVAMAVGAIAMFDPEAARGMVDTHLSGTMYGDAMLSAVDQIERQAGSPSSRDPREELESILSERGMMQRISRLHELVRRVASDDPVAAAELVDAMPPSSARHAVRPLLEAWARTDPREAARWLAEKNTRVAAEGLGQMAQLWGQRHFDDANAYADTLTGRKRAAFLDGLASVAHRLSKSELLAWVSRYEDDPAYPNLIASAAQRLAQEDVGAAMDLIEALPGEARLASYASVLPMLAFQDPEAAMGLIDDIGNESVRDQLLPMVSGMWAQNDAESALDWSLDLTRGRARDQALASISPLLAELDMDRAVDAIDEIDDPEVRKSLVRQLLSIVESDDEAIRLGRDYGFDRDAVLALREGAGGMIRPGIFAPYPVTSSSGTVVLRTNMDLDEDEDDEDE